MEVPHTNFTEVTWMVFVHVCSMMMRTTSKTTTTGMLPVLACVEWSVCVHSYTIRVFLHTDTTMTGGDMATVLPRLRFPSRHCGLLRMCGLKC